RTCTAERSGPSNCWPAASRSGVGPPKPFCPGRGRWPTASPRPVSASRWCRPRPRCSCTGGRLVGFAPSLPRPRCRRTGLASAAVTIVPNAVDPRAFDAAPPAADGFHVACAARLTPEKGVDVLVRAAALLRADVPDLRVLVLGGTQEGHEAHAAELTRLAAELGVADAVCFAGFVEHPFEGWAGARVY